MGFRTSASHDLRAYAGVLKYGDTRHLIHFDWKEVRWACEAGLFTGDYAIEKATDLYANDPDQPPEVEEMALMMPGDEVSGTLSRLAGPLDEASALSAQKKIVALLLRRRISSGQSGRVLLDFIERLYADLDYPEFMAPLVAYMPAPDPETASVPELIKTIERFVSGVLGLDP